MILCFAGADGGENYNNLLKKQGAYGRLESYYSLKNKKNSDFNYYLLDSGGFVARTKGININVKDYANYINKFNIKYVFELDTNNINETLKNRQYLNKYTKAIIIPIYHWSDYKEKRYKMLDDMIKNYKYIGIGGIAGENIAQKHEKTLYNFVFNKTRNKIKVHGLGITAKKILKEYPFYSVDSTSWLSMARYGNSKYYTKQMQTIKSKKEHYLKNTEKEIIYWLKLEKEITKL